MTLKVDGFAKSPGDSKANKEKSMTADKTPTGIAACYDSRKARLRTLILFSGILLLILAGTAAAATAQKRPEHRITGIDWQQSADAFLVTVVGEAPPTYTMYELFNPLRIILDIADAGLAESAGLPMKPPRGPISEISGSRLDDQEVLITRIELILAEDREYSAEKAGNNIVLKFPDTSTLVATTGKKAPAASSSGTTSPKSAAPARTFLLKDVVVTDLPGETRVLLQADGALEKFRKARLAAGQGQPDRLYIDIPGIRMAEDFKLVQVGSALARIRLAHRGTGLRAVFDSGLDRPFDFTIQPVPQGLRISIADSSSKATLLTDLASRGLQLRPETIPAASENIEPLFLTASGGAQPPAGRGKAEKQPLAAPAVKKDREPVSSPPAVAPPTGDNYQKISVDFFKIDLHNVFRLIGEISGRNIVVDEAVSGTLTLALNEVPWDFVLDVILNLKNLQKEERFNTIVISPKNKEFQWPKRPVDQLAVTADGAISQRESLNIRQRLETSAEIVEAKKLVHQGNDRYRAGDYQGALSLYEQAFAGWPENKQLAGHISMIALGFLGKNAKAVHYAKAVLDLDPTDGGAALQAAIGLANMKRTAEAKSYFDRAISSSRPSSEALLSYAAFCEENDSFQAALTLLNRHQQLYGSTFDSMIAKARIYDQLGRTEEAAGEYRSLLLAGFEIPADLERYIIGRLEPAGR